MSRVMRATMPSMCTSSPPSSTANSSPPSRATVVSSLSSSRSRCPTCWSRSSPASCPSVSLTSLNRSMSMSRTAAEPVVASRRSSRWWKCSRFARPVSGSVSARCSVSRAAARTRSTRPELASATLACPASASKSRASSRSKVLMSSSRSSTIRTPTTSPPSRRGAAMASTWPAARSRSCAVVEPPRSSRTSSPARAGSHQARVESPEEVVSGSKSTTRAEPARSSSRASASTVARTDSACRARSTDCVNR